MHSTPTGERRQGLLVDEANLLIGQVNVYEIVKAYLQLRQNESNLAQGRQK